jgi:hypothetical protein
LNDGIIEIRLGLQANSLDKPVKASLTGLEGNSEVLREE